MPTQTPSADEIDFAGLRAKYAHEKSRRLRKEGQAQFVRPTGDVAPDYAIDPHKAVARIYGATSHVNRCALFGEDQRDAAPDAATCAGDDNDFVCECFHLGSSFVTRE
jgi:hypothetical protein